MLNVKVVSQKVTERKGNAKLTGNPYHLRMQDVWVFTADRDGNAQPFPEKIEILLDTEKVDERGNVTTPEQPAYAPGEYVLHPSAIYVDKNGRLAVTPRLTPAVKRNA